MKTKIRIDPYVETGTGKADEAIFAKIKFTN